jgi:thioredoxin reductase
VFSVGRITTLAEADHLVGTGAADMVGMTRAHMTDPLLVKKARRGEPATRCIGANVCARRLVGNLPVACVLNPRMGREAEAPATPEPTSSPRRLVVVGGGPAGLKAAATAAAAGHAVTLIETTSTPGGRLSVLTGLPFRQRWQVAIDDLVTEAHSVGVDLRLDVTATVDAIEQSRPDLVLLATGSTWDLNGVTPFRPGRGAVAVAAGGPRRMALDAAVAAAVRNPATLGDGVVILDESFESSAAGLAILLAEAGRRVTILTPSATYADHLFQTYELPYFMRRIEETGVRVLAGVTFDAMNDDGMVTASSLFSGLTHRIEAVDTVVFAAGREPRRDLEAPLRQAGLPVRVIGDACAPRTVEAVLRDGFAAGRALWTDSRLPPRQAVASKESE